MTELSELPHGTVDYAFSLTQSVAFVGLASEFLTQQGMAGESSKALRAGLRVQFLGFLRTKGYQGIDDFLFTFISSLLERRKKLEA
eukprot:CAMPEP_0205935168 /NCGR_PEP_ID=MMETSP1325-20131115/38377_1 /ASSEMBLY_ACC=CAM_ASM_000708 /TAXON_ID=236786 /ORGANISM="Florenciella sp., Strain RCC1007" /LENGTH=85 /DNA_ID=CAMNT_0053305239 /DNA_START=33 /DNA_END=287 /DNA_ORIENTATION=-